MTENAPEGSPEPRLSLAYLTQRAAGKGLYLLPCIALVLQGCGKTPTEDWIVGGWTTAEESCNSGSGYIFERTGQWRTEGEEGTWKLDGSDLTINVTGTYDDDSESHEMKPSKDVYAYHITEFDKNSFASSASGKIPALKWKRCSFDLDQTPPAQEGQPAAPAPEPAAAPALPFFSSGVSCDGEVEKNAVYEIIRAHPEKNPMVDEIAKQMMANEVANEMNGQTRSTEAPIKTMSRINRAARDAVGGAVYNLTDIRVQSRDESLGNETCQANLTIEVQGYGRVTAPISVKVEKTTEGKPYVTVSGLR